jgi:hypothetical protein
VVAPDSPPQLRRGAKMSRLQKLVRTTKRPTS